MADDSTRLAICDDCRKPYVPECWPLPKHERPMCRECVNAAMANVAEATRFLFEEDFAALLGPSAVEMKRKN